jgi:hypothetical protein
LPRLYFKLIWLAVVSGLMLSVAARALGNTQQINPALRGFSEGCEAKSQPCWYGIVPGLTDFDTALIILSKNNFRVSLYGYPNFMRFSPIDDQHCNIFMTFTDKVVNKIQLWGCGHFELGEVQSILGEITAIKFEGAWSYEFGEYKISVVPTESEQLPPILKPDLSISQVTVQSTQEKETNRQIMLWRGYIHLSSYCRGQLEILACQ